MNNIFPKVLIFFTLFFVSNAIQINAQNLEWAKFFYKPTSSGAVNSVTTKDIKTDKLGNIYLLGRFFDSTDFDPGPNNYFLNSQNESYFILKLDPSGNFLWVKKFAKPVVIGNIYYEFMEIDNNDNIILSGILDGSVDFDPDTNSTFVLATTGSSSFVLKLDQNGNFVWVKNTINLTSSLFTTTQPRSIKIDANNEIVIGGVFVGSINFNPSGTNILTSAVSNQSDTYIWKLDAAGNFIWVKKMVGGDFYELDIDKNNNVLAVGRYRGTIDFDPSTNVFNMTTLPNIPNSYIWKLNTNGDFVWAKKIEYQVFVFSNNLRNLVVDKENNYVFTGTFTDSVNLGLNGIPHIYYSNKPKATSTYIFKTDSNANFIWANTWHNAYFYSIEADKENSIYAIVEPDDSLDVDPAGNIVNVYGNEEFYFKLDKQGNYINYCKYNKISNSNNDLNILFFHVDENLNIYTTGFYNHSFSFNCNLNSNFYHDSIDGNAFLTKSSQWPLSISESENTNYNSIPYPNPTNSEINLRLDGSLSNTINIYNLIGQKVKSIKNIKQQNYKFYLEQPDGIYLLEIVNSKSNYRYKIIKN